MFSKLSSSLLLTALLGFSLYPQLAYSSHFAQLIAEGNIELIEFALENKSGIEDINEQDDYGSTYLIFASQLGNFDVIKTLIEHGADVNIVNGYKNTALMHAVEKNNADIVQLLLENKADMEVKNRNGYTALMIAIEKSSYESAQLLLQNKADMTASDHSDFTPLMLTAFHNTPEIAKLLLDFGADPRSENEHGKSAFDIAIMSSSQVLKVIKEYENK